MSEDKGELPHYNVWNDISVVRLVLVNSPPVWARLQAQVHVGPENISFRTEGYLCAYTLIGVSPGPTSVVCRLTSRVHKDSTGHVTQWFSTDSSLRLFLTGEERPAALAEVRLVTVRVCRTCPSFVCLSRDFKLWARSVFIVV